jgi:hypothetical protein
LESLLKSAFVGAKLQSPIQLHGEIASREELDLETSIDSPALSLRGFVVEGDPFFCQRAPLDK